MENSFEQFNLNKQLLTAIEEAGYLHPTPIQLKAFNPVYNGQNVIGIAPTGTGKTAAYALPLLMKLKYAQGEWPRALIIAPTRELGIQIYNWVNKLAKNTDLRTVVLYGGTGTKLQKEQLALGFDILISTPGRFMELYLSGDIPVKNIKHFILDEADKMLDMGFMPAINKILEVIPRKRQNMLFSATMSARVQQLAGNFIEFPTIVEVEPQATPAQTVQQRMFELPNVRTKIKMLELLLQDHEVFHKVIVFCKTRSIADDVYKFIQRKFGIDQVRVIHANKGQNTRLNNMNDFRNSEVRILVSTDVSARGIDIPAVSHVINFDVPLIYEDYVHRIGRTGRASLTGESITFTTKAEEYHIAKIEKIIRMKIPREPLPSHLEIFETPFDEEQLMLKEIDVQKRKENPEFQGAFHEKKNLKAINTAKSQGKSSSKAMYAKNKQQSSRKNSGKPNRNKK